MDIAERATFGDRLEAQGLAIGGPDAPADRPMFDWLATRFLGDGSSADPLVALLDRSSVLAPLSGWRIGRAWVSQEPENLGSEGDPLFVGFGRPEPVYSLLSAGMVLDPDAFKARDVIPPEGFVYLAIFALAGAILAAFLDRKDRGQFWRAQTLGLRLVCWPALLVALGNIAIDYALANMSLASVELVDKAYHILWWLVPARLLVITLERFLWVPLERRTGRKVPNAVRSITAFLVYLFALFGIVAFVMGQAITSLLATTGVSAMILGLAIRANVADIFSGIVLNIERPFGIGDHVGIGRMRGQVIDISWRTTRVKTYEGELVSLPNGKVAEAEIHNYSRTDGLRVFLRLQIDPHLAPDLVVSMIETSVAGNRFILRERDDQRPKVRFLGVVPQGGYWVAEYEVLYQLANPLLRKPADQDLWLQLWPRLREAGVSWRFTEAPELPSVPRLQALTGA